MQHPVPRHAWLPIVALALAACGPLGAAVAPAAKPSGAPAAKHVPTLPTRVNLVLPGSLGPLLGDNGASLISQDGGSIVAQGGGNLISQDGGSIVAQGGGNYRLVACAAPQGTGQAYFHDIMDLALVPYAESVLIVNGVLAKSLAGGIDLDKPKTIDDPRAPGKLTVMLSATPTGGLLKVAEGTSYVDANQILAVSFTSPTQGVAVYRSPALHPTLGHLAISTHFDLDNGKVDADGIADPTVLPAATDPFVYRAHWEFTSYQAAQPDGTTFKMRVAAFLNQKGDACQTGARGVTANFLPNGQAAVRMGRVLPGKSALSFTRNDGKGYDDTANVADDFYLDTDGKTLTSGMAPAKLQGLAPGADQFYTPFPPDPGAGAPFADPVFNFPNAQ